jgi:hypothetical protein
MPHQKRSGRKPKGRSCEALPNGGVLALGKATTEALKRKGNYRTREEAKKLWGGKFWGSKHLTGQPA